MGSSDEVTDFCRDDEPEKRTFNHPDGEAVVLKSDDEYEFEGPKTTVKPLKSPPLRRNAKSDNPADAAPHKARPSRRNKNAPSAIIPANRRKDSNNVPMTLRTIPGHRRVACSLVRFVSTSNCKQFCYF